MIRLKKIQGKKKAKIQEKEADYALKDALAAQEGLQQQQQQQQEDGGLLTQFTQGDEGGDEDLIFN